MRKPKPCFAIIPFSGNQWTVENYCQFHNDGNFTISSHEGYGILPEKYYHLPIIDLRNTDDKQLLSFINLNYPKEINPQRELSLNEFFNKVKSLNIPIINLTESGNNAKKKI